MSVPCDTKRDKTSKESGSAKNSLSQKGRQHGARISAACEACKRRKTKCTGGPSPCQLCKTLNTECIIDLALDMRRRAAMQRTIDESKFYLETLNGLIAIIRDGDPQLGALTAFLQSANSQEDTMIIIRRYAQAVQSFDFNTGMENLLETTTQEGSGADFHTERDTAFSGLRALSVRSLSTQVDPNSDIPISEARKAKVRETDEYLRTLLQRLRLSDDVECENILRGLIEPAAVVEENIKHEDFEGAGTSFATDNIQNSQRMPAMHQSPSSASSPPNGGTDHMSAGINADKLYPSVQEFDSYTEVAEPISATSGDSPIDINVLMQSLAPRLGMPLHLAPPLLLLDYSNLSRVYTDYLRGARQLMAGGTPQMAILGSQDKICVDLIFRGRRDGDGFDCSSWASELCRTFGNFDQFVLLAFALNLTLMMQWMLFPNLESYAKLPEMMKPTQAQRLIPHFGMIELCIMCVQTSGRPRTDLLTSPSPAIRDVLIHNPREWKTAFLEAGISVNWPYTLADAVEYDPRTGEAHLSQHFMSHAADQRNWSFSSSILDSFPEVAGQIQIHNILAAHP